MNDTTVKVTTRKSVSAPLSKFDPSANPSSFIEVTEWANGEGYDVSIDNKILSLSYDELSAINFLSKLLEIETSE